MRNQRIERQTGGGGKQQVCGRQRRRTTQQAAPACHLARHKKTRPSEDARRRPRPITLDEGGLNARPIRIAKRQPQQTHADTYAERESHQA